jgi:hypothetical protein
LRRVKREKLRTGTEIDMLLRAAGFEVLEFFGGWAGGSLSRRSERVFVLARQPL